MPSWLTKGRAALLEKDTSKVNIASIYRAITSLPLMWKLLSSVIADQIYGSSDQLEVVTRRTERMEEKI